MEPSGKSHRNLLVPSCGLIPSCSLWRRLRLDWLSCLGSGVGKTRAWTLVSPRRQLPSVPQGRNGPLHPEMPELYRPRPRHRPILGHYCCSSAPQVLLWGQHSTHLAWSASNHVYWGSWIFSINWEQYNLTGFTVAMCCKVYQCNVAEPA